MAYMIQTTQGMISLDASSFENAQAIAVDMLGYELIQPRQTQTETSTLTSTETCQICGIESTKTLNKYGRKIAYCDTHYEFEAAKLNKQAYDSAQADTNLPFKIEQVVKKTVNHSIQSSIELYNNERTNWLVENFESAEQMRDALIQFIVSIENLVFEKKNKLRAAYDAARELDASLSKTERDALINDPKFKAPENKEFKKKITKGTKESKARAALEALGITSEAIDAMLAK